ncbi:MAG: hypothetical protein BIFFINMI_03390 [Phycisphaerae bacterium]|nr:hypothetical protein [Phycisphaerae bacterium]
MSRSTISLLTMVLLCLAVDCRGAEADRPPADAGPPAPTTQAAEAPAPETQEDGDAAATPQTALELYARGDYAAVVKMLSLRTGDESAGLQERLLLARARVHLGQDAEALKLLKGVLADDPTNPEANRLAGTLLAPSAEAIDYLKRAWKAKESPDVAGLLGQCCYQAGKTAEAKEFLEKALAEDVRNPMHSLLLGRIWLDRGVGALAEKYFLMAQDAGADDIDAHIQIGQAYAMQHKFLGPILVRRLKTDAGPPKPGDVVDEYAVLGVADKAAGTHRVTSRYCAFYEGLAVRALMAEVPHTPGTNPLDAPAARQAQTWVARGFLLAGELEEAAKRSAGQSDIQAELAIAGADGAAIAKAVESGLRANAFGAAAAADLLYRGAVAVRGHGQRGQAFDLLVQADKLDPTNGPVLRAMASLQRALGDDDGAHATYQRIIELFPDADDIEELRNSARATEDAKGASDTDSQPNAEKGGQP